MTELFNKIIHIDMDAFFASVEQLDFPEYRNKPIVVGGQPNSRGVVAAASYEARKFGIRSAMPAFQAAQRCPNLIFVKPRFERYKALSEKIQAIFREYTPIVEPLSIDEAYLDVTDVKRYRGSATLMAQAIQKQIYRETGLVASAGVSYNKFLAKLASDYKKPNGFFVIEPNNAIAIIKDLPVKHIYGVGNVTQEKMHQLNIKTIGDITRFGKELLTHHFGKQGGIYYNLSIGLDSRQVITARARKSIGRETTFAENSLDNVFITKKLMHVVEEVHARLLRHEVTAKTVTLKIKYFDFELITRSKTLQAATQDKTMISKTALALLANTLVGTKAIRLVGVSLANLENAHDDVLASGVLFKNPK